MANSPLKNSFLCRRRGDESQISSVSEVPVRDSLRRLLLFQRAANALRMFKFFILPACVAAVMAMEATSLAADAARPQAASVLGTIKKVAVIADAELDESARYGIRKLEAVLRAKGVTVTEGEGHVSGSDFVLLAGLGSGRGAAANALAGMNVAAPSGAESVSP